ncbi:MAG TPA: NAD(P)-dependent oxidoreductase [Gaiellaceae bacterium]|nr:NAD(P)-dependent oxidoreductase [Gaiellaceae bacterium]
MSGRPVALVVDDGELTRTWPFVGERLESRLAGTCEVRVVGGPDPAALADAEALAWFARAELAPADVAAAPRLRVAGGVVDGLRPAAWPALRERGIPFVDATRAWAPSVAETGLALAICALRRIPQLHRAMAEGTEPWIGRQFTDDPDFVNGDLGTKRVGVLGLGQIGGRIAGWCTALGSDVAAHDPYAPDERFAAAGAARLPLDELCARSEVLVVAVPPTPSAAGMLDARLVDTLPRGAVVVTITRTAPVDTAALRRRVLAGELAWATDVYDVEPLPAGDPIRGLRNVVHVPHIAGRTRDTNLRVADLLAADFLAVLAGGDASGALTEAAATVRGGDG